MFGTAIKFIVRGYLGLALWTWAPNAMADVSETRNAPPFAAVIQGLPSGSALVMHAGIFFEDLRTTLRHQEAVLHPELEVVTRALEAEVASRFFGVNLVSELTLLLDLLAPEGHAVPAAVVLFETPEQPLNVQLMLKTHGAAQERLLPKQDGPQQPSILQVVKAAEEHLTVRLGKLTWLGRIDEQGWLRIGPAPTMLLGTAADRADSTVFAPAMAQQLRGMDAVLWVAGGRWLAPFLLNSVGQQWAGILSQLRTVALAWGLLPESTGEVRLLGDAPLLARFAPMVRQAGLGAELIKIWGKELTGALSVSLPAALLGALLEQLEQNLAGTPMALPAAMQQALSGFKGSFNIVGFPAPGDWAVGIELNDEQAATRMVPAVEEWLAAVAAHLEIPRGDFWSLSQGEGEPAALEIRADPALAGVKVAALGSQLVVVRQRARYAQLLQRSQQPAGFAAGTVAGPLTQAMRQLVEQPAMGTGYMVYGGDSSVFDIFAWAAKAFEVYRQRATNLQLKAGVDLAWESSLLPTALQLAMMGGQSMMVYDVGLSLDVLDEVLVLRFAYSYL